MLKVNHVYVYKKTRYVFVKAKLKRKNRTVYELATVTSHGSLGKTTIKRYVKGFYKPAPQVKVKVEIKLSLPKEDADQIHFERIISDIREQVKLLKFKDKKDRARTMIGQLMMGAIDLKNRSTGEHYTLQEVATALKMKRNRKGYRWVTQTLQKRVDLGKTGVKSMADSTLSKCYDNYVKYFGSIVGFYYELDDIIKKNMTLIIKEKKRRGLL